MSQVVAAVVICLFLAFASPANAQARYALLIGNQAYASQLGPLKNPVNDVALIAEALVRVGFKRRNIRIVRNADRVSLLSAVDDYVAELRTAGEGAVGFFYYSGHGVASKRDKRNYLIPIGVERLDRKVWYKSVALDDVISRLSGSAPNAAHFVIFDACRNHLRLPTKGSKGFVPTRTRRGMLIAFSTDPGETASDEGDSSGPYASALASELTRRGQNHLDLFQNVKERVYRTTGIQVPWTRDGMLQRVYLAGRTTSQSASIASNKQQAAPPISRAAKEWAEIQHTQSVAVLENFAQKFKDSVFATFAMARVRELQQVQLAKNQQLAALEDVKHRRTESAQPGNAERERSAALVKQPGLAPSSFLTGAQIRSKLVGRTVTYSGESRGTITIRANGSATLVDQKHGRSKGRWWTRRNDWCRRWAKWPEKAKCFRFRDLGNGRLRSSNGYTLTIR